MTAQPFWWAVFHFWQLGKLDADPAEQSCAGIYADRRQWFAKVMQFNGALSEKMTLRSRWLAAGFAVVIVVLLLGRWRAVGAADLLWANALAVGDAHAEIARVRTLLFVAAFMVAAAWCLGNLWLVYRSIGSVTVPRRLGNIEIVEAVPRQYLLVGFTVLGIGLALAMSFQSGEWWQIRALASGGAIVGLSDPIFQRDASYYLFSLPRTRTLHSYATLLAAAMLGVVLILYAAVGAVRTVKRQIEVNDQARGHLGALFATFALALVWGYRLEPAEYLAGIHNVPFDSVLLDVRLPTARLLSAVGLITCAASLLWIRSARTSLVLFGWGALAVLSFVGHYLVPAVAAGVRTDAELRSALLEEVRGDFTEYAYGLHNMVRVSQPSPRAFPDSSIMGAAELTGPILWDEFAVNRLLNRVARREPYLRFATSSLGSYRTEDGRVVPVVVAVREVNLSIAQVIDPAFSWERIHMLPYGAVQGVVAVRADMVSPDGRPHFISDLQRPDSVTSSVIDVALGDSPLLFGPTTGQFAVVSKGSVAGVPVGGFVRRLALAWKLQSWKLLTSPALDASSMVVWNRSVGDRLEAVAPFATFGPPRPMVVNKRLFWTAFGYVASTSFPLSERSEWLGASVGLLRAGFVGVVDALTGETSVFLLPDGDALSRTWAELAPEIVSPWHQMPEDVRQHLVYPEALFHAQLRLLDGAEELQRAGFFGRLRPPEGGPAGNSFWWLSSASKDGVAPLRRLSTIQADEPARLAGLVEGRMTPAGPVLTEYQFRRPWELPSPEQTAGRFVAERGVDAGVVGPLKIVPVGDGILSLQSTYANPTTEDSVPVLISVAVEWAGAVGEAPTFSAALTEALAADRSAEAVSTDWAAARRWFERLDVARESGDWIAFGRAYEQLRQLLMGDSISCREPGCSR